MSNEREIELSKDENNINNNDNNKNNNNDINNNNELKDRGQVFIGANFDDVGKEELDIRLGKPKKDDEDKPVDIKSPEIWEGFPLFPKCWYKIFFCWADHPDNTSYTDECLKNQCNRDKSLELTDKILSISILKSGTLEIIPGLVHPFVRMSIFNINTGKYLQKSNFDRPAVSRRERSFTMKNDKQKEHIIKTDSTLDFIPPISTCPYDLREKGESFAEWNEEFHINEDAAHLLNSNNILFFELLDYNLDFSDNDIENCIIPIAWGYLKLVGFSRTYIGKHKIQLYKYSFSRKENLTNLKTTDENYLRTPDVCYEIDWIKKEKYQTFLQIELTLNNRPTDKDLQKKYYYDKYYYSVFVPEGDDDNDLLRFQKKKEKEISEKPKKDKEIKLLKWRRNPGEPCMIPNQLLYKFPTAKLGCLTHEFSRNGKYIAAACTELSSETTIRIYDIEDGVLRYHFKGHHQIVHDLTWSFDDLILFSSSADNDVSIWKVPQGESNDIENVELLDNNEKFKLGSISHPAYVYACDIFPIPINKSLIIIATACFDGIVRIYTIYFNYNGNIPYPYSDPNINLSSSINICLGLDSKDYFARVSENLKQQAMKKKDKDRIVLLEKTALDHRHPNSLVFNKNGQLFIGDSLGLVHIWDVRVDNNQLTLNKVRAITDKELEHDTINKITLIPGETKRLLIHSRDNCIRVLDFSDQKAKIILRYFGSKCNKINIKSTISPDGSYVFAGSEEGIPHIWSMESTMPVGTKDFECQFIDSVNDVSWNNCYNITGVSAFGQEYPLLIHVYEKDDEQIMREQEEEKKLKRINKEKEHMFGIKKEENDDMDYQEKINMQNNPYNNNNMEYNNNNNNYYEQPHQHRNSGNLIHDSYLSRKSSNSNLIDNSQYY